MATGTTLESWTRIESHNRNWDFSENLSNAIHDPLWMLTRQWQFGEFQGEDAGSAVFAKIAYQDTALDQLKLADNEWQRLDKTLPLDAVVERIQCPLDLNLRIEMGRHWFKMIKKQLPADQRTKVKKAFQEQEDLKFEVPTLDETKNLGEQANILAQESQLQMLHAAIRAGYIDGGTLYQRLKSGESASTFLAEADTAVDEIGNQFVAWFDRVYNQPISTETDAWQPTRLEYQFGYTAPNQHGDLQNISAEEYHGKRLGWYSGDIKASLMTVNGTIDQVAAPIKKVTSFIPTPVRFAGMPNPRWWKLEDNTINFGDIGTATTDLAKLIFAEFGLVYSNDWLLTPLQIPSGHISKVEKIMVTDSFGMQTEIRPAHEMKPNEPWQLFNIFNTEAASNADHQLFMPPINNQLLESKPIEEVHFMRDEMANMVWGIEKIVPDGMGSGMDGFESGLRQKAFLKELAGKEALDQLENEAEVYYKLATQVPENWIPFVPKKISDTAPGAEIHLQRAAMPRVLNGFAPERVRPRTSLLREGLDRPTKSPFFINEEEIPRSGAIVKLKWRRTRWLNGKVVVWLARERTNGRGEGDSALQFDRIQEKVNQ